MPKTEEQKFLRTLIDPEIGTHAHILGSSGSGKSRFIESLIRTALYETPGFCVIDWHGNLYDGILNYLAYHQTDHREIYLLDPASGDFITPYNPFRTKARNPVGAANAYLNALLKTWGAPDTNATPRIEQVSRILFLAAILSGETLPNVALLLRQEHDAVRRWVFDVFTKSKLLFMLDELKDLEVVPPSRWADFVVSTLRRLGRLLADPAISRFLSVTEGGLNISDLMDRGAVILVNLADRDYLDRESARAFASLLMADFFRVAMRRSVKDEPEPFILFMDEFQEYITPDSPKMLDAVRKGGLHLVMAHQRLEQLNQAQSQIRDAILQNARIKACFAIDDYETAKFMAQQLFIRELNENKIKDEIRRWETTGQKLEKHRVQSYSANLADTSNQSVSHWDGQETPSSAEGHGQVASMGGSVGTALLLRNILEYNVSNRTFYNPEEKLNLLAERLMTLDQRKCFIRFMTEIPILHSVPNIERYSYDEWNLEQYVYQIFERIGALNPEEADALSLRSREDFLLKVSPPKKQKHPREIHNTPPNDDVIPNKKRPS